MIRLLKDVYKDLRARLFFFINSLLLRKNSVSFHPDIKIQGRLVVQNRGTFTIGKAFRCNSSLAFNPIGGDDVSMFIVREGGSLNIGANVAISNSAFVVTDHIEIEDNVRIGGSCKVWDTDFHALDPYIRIVEEDSIINSKPIKIGRNAFIGANSIILKGVVIGKNAIVGAGSVVSKDIPDDEIWAGNPARFIKKVEKSAEV